MPLIAAMALPFVFGFTPGEADPAQSSTVSQPFEDKKDVPAEVEVVDPEQSKVKPQPVETTAPEPPTTEPQQTEQPAEKAPTVHV